MTRTYEFDLTTGEFIPVFIIDGSRTAAPDWDAIARAAYNADLAASVASTLNAMQTQLAAAIGPLLETFSAVVEAAELEVERAVDTLFPQIRAVAAVLLAAADRALAALPPAPEPFALAAPDLLTCAVTAPRAPEPSTTAVPAARTGWLAHPNWNGVNGLIALVIGVPTLVLAVLAYFGIVP